MPRRSRWLQISLLVVVTALAWWQPQTASAWHGRWRAGLCGVGFRPWCGPVFGPRCYGGWYGGSRFFASETVSLGGPCGGGFFSGSVNSFVLGGPRWWGRPCWSGPAFGLPCTFYPYSYGCGYGGPILVSPYGGWLPASIAPVYGPAGVLPFMGVMGASTNPPAARLAALPPILPGLQLAARDPARTIPTRSSNGEARLRAGRLVAIGDRHLRAAVLNPAKMPAALDAYRRAAIIAPDLADTFLRQAIVLTALDRAAAAAQAVDRAVALDARLGSDAPAALAARERLTPDPVFGDQPDSGPTTLAARTQSLLARVFQDVPAARGGARADAAAGNWIVDRWLQQWQGPANAFAAR